MGLDMKIFEKFVFELKRCLQKEKIISLESMFFILFDTVFCSKCSEMINITNQHILGPDDDKKRPKRNQNPEFQFSSTNSFWVLEMGHGSAFEMCRTLLMAFWKTRSCYLDVEKYIILYIRSIIGSFGWKMRDNGAYRCNVSLWYMLTL